MLAPRRDTVSIPLFWIVLLLSVLVHVAVLFLLPSMPRRQLGLDPEGPLAVELRPPPAPAPAPQPKVVPPAAPAPRAAYPLPISQRN